MFYLTTHSTHLTYGYMTSDIWLRTIVRKETRCRHIGYSLRLTARVLLYAPSNRQDNTHHGLCYTSRGALAGRGAGRSSWCDGSSDRSFMGMNPLSYFSFQPVLNDWCNKGRGMCYPVCGMVHIKEPLLLLRHSSPCGSSGFPPYLGERCSSVVRAFAHGALSRQIDPSWGGPIELFLVPASAPRLE